MSYCILKSSTITKFKCLCYPNHYNQVQCLSYSIKNKFKYFWYKHNCPSDSARSKQHRPANHLKHNKLPEHLLILQNTVLDWIVAEEVNREHLTDASGGVCTEDEGLEAFIAQLWELDEVRLGWSSSSIHITWALIAARCNGIGKRSSCTAQVLPKPGKRKKLVGWLLPIKRKTTLLWKTSQKVW